MNHPTRRTMLKSTLALVATAAAVPAFGQSDAPATRPAADGAPDPHPDGLKLGVATYTLRLMPLDQTIADIRRVGLAYCSIKDTHLPLKSSAAERKAVADKFRAAGITPLSCGVISIHSEADARQAFEYARDAGIPAIVAAPTHEMLPTLDKLVKEFDIKIAIHTHGPQDKFFPSPYDVWSRVQDLDPRVGLCIDVGHTAHAGVAPQDAIAKCGPRLYDCHMKDVVSHDPKAKFTEVGRGVLDIPAILKALVAIKMPGHVGFEHEIDPKDPMPGLAEDVGYVRGVLRMLPA